MVIGVPVYNNFFSSAAHTGYYTGPSGDLDGYHAITALDYNTTGLVIENSWGTSWGNKGYATLSSSFVNGYVFDAVAVSSLRIGPRLAPPHRSSAAPPAGRQAHGLDGNLEPCGDLVRLPVAEGGQRLE